MEEESDELEELNEFTEPTENILWHVIWEAEIPQAGNIHCQAMDMNYVSVDTTNLATVTIGVLLQLSNGL
jgi:hypothetical protein